MMRWVVGPGEGGGKGRLQYEMFGCVCWGSENRTILNDVFRIPCTLTSIGVISR